MEIIRKLFLAVLLIVPSLLYAETVNINTADKETLATLKGVGEKLAEAIISYRENHGPFKSIEELVEIRGIGQVVLDDNRNNLSVSDNQ